MTTTHGNDATFSGDRQMLKLQVLKEQMSTCAETLRAQIFDLEDRLREAQGEPRVRAKAIERQSRGEPISVARALATLRAMQSGDLRR